MDLHKWTYDQEEETLCLQANLDFTPFIYSRFEGKKAVYLLCGCHSVTLRRGWRRACDIEGLTSPPVSAQMQWTL
ncbi:hypothetical protein AAFF_G00256620 [Aldrovandia affinis]|uniref:Uncharacterized protein n=1 Tax=Aldrovandia affinis TaxID=143900 RepID=A0AAD7ST53_9TELE|nr:hypothetical protein AAFF_G00256620 [Aldrovandia affinis]